MVSTSLVGSWNKNLHFKALIMDQKLRREYDPHVVFIPQESSAGFIRTSDGETYRRGEDGVIRGLHSRKNGKVARKARAAARRTHGA